MESSSLTNKFSNYKKLIELAETDWHSAKRGRICELNVTVTHNNYLTDQYERNLHHFCTTSYLGLDHHPSIIDGAIQGIREAKTLRIANSKNRCKLEILERYELELSAHFNSICLSTLSCSAASSGLLPLLASGAFTNNCPPTMVFDKQSHYSMNHIKAACADETEVKTAPHNDLSFIEDLCKKRKYVAYIADGIYSMGGVADVEGLLYLKARYGLFLYMDDSHALSAFGEKGYGFIRPCMRALDDQTLIVASLGKSFGASGGLIMFGTEQQKSLMYRYGGPSNWSQSLNSAAIGAGLASLKIHQTEELRTLQEKLQSNIQLFDKLIHTEQHGTYTAIRLITCGEADKANALAIQLSDIGFFTSAVFFPVVPRGRAAVRITLRADMSHTTIKSFCTQLALLMDKYKINN
ncbi:aminotransferase class I/II-fold pyridoxal phosphate-dependent enzyme [Pseudomonas haemolytica]|uniref:Aminotransferase class I/II-fold pyridoxal phosphate-dependent enzyme n=1 Tax=Pseudomonas haemolytica TaxID=2600065 RepID=A0A5P1D6L7_9PSED|nr:aminotransferase class I/II-fold pyridoxal phosphate-dependent enzyme [Pseudomonas haemolytica]MBJ2247260.1 aminotransferase class I/II-fold pyridoxal phosphate-dependent enzyme [Pseudomonas haemolytica]MBJ2272071.1 aminotransferase class I/II-fold pyridoxal phosphate-dependent enzyme [Pseudomonas haemolytica]MBK3450255.1 aminotransferase class I/II-fold pyridoxal phosphate-dependent enzyme [Pseudomonas haemolytica]MBK3461836.1 aminotransferase class I/II-fold pyridoxal phosphate-dependent e